MKRQSICLISLPYFAWFAHAGAQAPLGHGSCKIRYPQTQDLVENQLINQQLQSSPSWQEYQQNTTKPQSNIIFILTDDQDVHLNSQDFMPLLQKHLIQQGTSFNRHYVTTAVCCPSRVNLWTGKASHNTNITDVKPPYGGYPKFVANGFNEDYLPVWLQDAGYSSYYVGKLFNGHSVDYYDQPYPAGFTGTDFLLDPYTYNYVNATFQRNRDPPRSYEGQYSTDLVRDKAYGFLDDAAKAYHVHNKPFFLTVAPIAPHSNIEKIGGFADAKYGAPIPAPRHAHLFDDEKVPRGHNWNPDRPSGANWLLKLPRQNETNVAYNDDFHRNRLRSLQAVDELVDGLVTRLEEHELLENTYLVYSSDNGFHIGQHRLQPGKSCGYEEDIHVPMILRGPGIAKGYSTDMVTTHTDLASTFLKILGIAPRDGLDGRAFPVTKEDIEAQAAFVVREHVAVEYWGFAGGEGIHDRELHENNTYKAIRLISEEFNVYYAIWCNNEHELYDMGRDPGQMNNLLSTEGDKSKQTIFGLPVAKIISRLDALLFVLKSCDGGTCQDPWKQLHPAGNVRSLRDAINHQYDVFYESEQVRVDFSFCWNGYWPEAEGPMFEDVGKAFLDREGLAWDAWT